MNETHELPAAVAVPPPPVEVAPADPPRRRRVRHWEPLAFGLGGFAVCFTSIFFVNQEMVFPATAVGVLGLAGLLAAIVQGVRIVIQESEALEAAVGLVQVILALPFAFLGAIIVLMDAAGGFRRGRQLRRRGRLQLPPLGRGTGWTTLPSEACEAPEAKALAAQWRENGRTEHASVAAFSRLSLDLLGLGAPARLLKQAQADALDEIRHAELCFSLAHDLDGAELEPVAFPAAAEAGPRSRIRSVALVQVAIDSLIEGALHEGLSARVVAQLARSVTQPRLQSLLSEIARDEGRHAAHAWDVLEWCLEQGGLPVRAAVAAALQRIPLHLETELPEAARGGAWIPYGIHGAGLESRAYSEALASVRRRTEELVGAAPTAMAA